MSCHFINNYTSMLNFGAVNISMAFKAWGFVETIQTEGVD